MSDWFTARYGSRKGFAKSKWHQLLYYFGRYREYAVPWGSIERLVFVCSGNICRSAFAETVAKSLGVDAISVGLHAIEGEPANAQAIITAKSLGYDLTTHRTTPVMYPVFKKTDLFIAMEPWQAEIIKKNLSRKHHATLLGIWAKPTCPYIDDPYLRSESYFKYCFNYIEKSVHAISDKIRKAN